MNIRHITHSWIKGSVLTLLVISLAVPTAWPTDNSVPASGDEKQPEEDYQRRFVLADTGGSRFEQTCDTWSDRKYTVSRVCVELGNYDGPPGYTAILLRSMLAGGPGIREEIVTAFPKGQYHLFMFEPESYSVYAYELEQRGSGVYITGLRVFSPDKLEGERIGPRGIYRYASCSPTGTFCLLVDAGITVYQLESDISKKVENVSSISVDAAALTNMVDGFSLSGRFVQMRWATDTSGKLLIRDEKGDTIREIDIDLNRIFQN